MSEEPVRVVVTPDMVITPRELVMMTGGRRSGKRLALYRALLRHLKEHPDARVTIVALDRR